MDVRMRTRRRKRRGEEGEANEKIKGRCWQIERGNGGTRSKDRKRKRERARRTAKGYDGDGGKKHELGGRRGMLISDFPFVRSVHLLGKRLFGALFPPYGWMATNGGKDSHPYEKAEHTPRTTFSVAKFHEDQPTGDERRENSSERIADRLSPEISEVRTSREVSPSFSACRCLVADVYLFLLLVAEASLKYK